MDTESAALTTDTAPVNPVAAPLKFDPAPDIYTQAHGKDVWAEMPIALLDSEAPLTVWGGVRAPRIPIPTPTLNPGERIARVTGRVTVLMGEPRTIATSIVRFDNGYRTEWGRWDASLITEHEHLMVLPRGAVVVVGGPNGGASVGFPGWSTLVANVRGGLVINHAGLLGAPWVALAAKALPLGLEDMGVMSDIYTANAVWGTLARYPTEPTTVVWAAARYLRALRELPPAGPEATRLRQIAETHLRRIVDDELDGDAAEKLARGVCCLVGSGVDSRPLALAARLGYPHNAAETNDVWASLTTEERMVVRLFSLQANHDAREAAAFVAAYTELTAAGHVWTFPALAEVQRLADQRRNSRGWGNHMLPLEGVTDDPAPEDEPVGPFPMGVTRARSAIWTVWRNEWRAEIQARRA